MRETKYKLRECEELIWKFQQLVNKFPNNKEYNNSLVELQQQRVDIVNQIGRPK